MAKIDIGRQLRFQREVIRTSLRVKLISNGRTAVSSPPGRRHGPEAARFRSGPCVTKDRQQPVAQVIKESGKAGGGSAGFMDLHHRVMGMATIAQRFGAASSERDHAFQMRAEDAKIGACPRFGPGLTPDPFKRGRLSA